MCALFLLLNLVIASGEELAPEGFSYNNVSQSSDEWKSTWKPIVIVNETLKRNSSKNPIDDSKMRRLGSRSLKSKEFSYRDPPARQYLPQFGDSFPPETTTLIPIVDEEFINQSPFHDEPEIKPPGSSSGYTYVTPQVPFNELRPPMAHDEIVPFKPHAEYLPANHIPTFHSIGTYETKKKILPLQLEVNEMRCFDTPTDGRFQALLTFRSNENIPVLEDMTKNGNGFCEVNSDSPPPLFNTNVHINISKNDFHRCGVRDCSSADRVTHMCVKIRFPTVPKMKLPEDPVLTLHCRVQDRIVSHIKHLKIDVDNVATGRSAGAIAKGGSRGTLRTRVALYRRDNRGDFTEILPSRARVPLGDIIMLRADVEPGDGWTSSRFSSIVMRRDNEGSNEEEITLLQSDGCRDPQAYSLCPKDPIIISPLRHTLFIRAAQFEGMNNGDEVKLSVKLVACLEAGECHSGRCEIEGARPRGPQGPQGALIRSRRSDDLRTANTTSEVSFAIVIDEDVQFKGDHTIVFFGIAFSVVVVCFFLVLLLKKIVAYNCSKRYQHEVGKL